MLCRKGKNSRIKTGRKAGKQKTVLRGIIRKAQDSWPVYQDVFLERCALRIAETYLPPPLNTKYSKNN